MNVQGIFDALSTEAEVTGLFEQINGHEPKNGPSNGITYAHWIQRIDPLPEGSGLNMTTGRLLFFVRLYQNFQLEPQDAIDPMMVEATTTLIEQYSGNFTLDGLVKNVDLLGMYGTPLSAEAGYIEQSKGLFRAITITLPLIVNDLWNQEAL